jgi:hypothetical protein
LPGYLPLLISGGGRLADGNLMVLHTKQLSDFLPFLREK